MEGTQVYESFLGNRSCDESYIPMAGEHLESWGSFGVGLLSAGVILATLTLYFAVDACCNVYHQKESVYYKSNVIMILWLYPLASFFCLAAIGIPRAQILAETAIQIFLMIVLYRVYLMMIDLGRRAVTKPAEMNLKVGPCCCWLPLPVPEMTDGNLFWLGILILQLPIVQSIINCCFLFMSIEEPGSQENYRFILEPFAVVSILLGAFALNVAERSLKTVVPEARLRSKVLLSQAVLLCSKLQSSVIRNVARNTDLFPCNPPTSPAVYGSVTCNCLMLIEMLLLCYAARHYYYVELESVESSGPQPTDRTKDNVEAGDLANNNEASKETSPV